MELHRTAAFLRGYRFLPHRLLNRAAGALTRARRPRLFVRAAIRAWVRRDGIALDEFEPDDWPTVEAFFLRRLRPGARPLGSGIVSPADGVVVACGEITSAAMRLSVKGRALSIDRIVNGAHHRVLTTVLGGGRYVVLFLTPRGYHHVHMPADGVVEACHFVPGRFFPQNEDALRHVDAVYERNERALLRLRLDGCDGEALLVMVGASLIGGIHLDGVGREEWVDVRRETRIGRRRAKGERIGHFTFGSTVVLLVPPGHDAPLAVRVGDLVRMGQSLCQPPSRSV